MVTSFNPPTRTFFLVAFGVFLSTLDSSMMNVALPFIMSDLQITLLEVERIVIVYLLVITVSLVFWGRLSDRVGKKRIYLTGVIIFSLGATGCFLAPGYTLLLVTRIIQALGASMMMSTGPAIIKVTTAENSLGRTMGMVGIFTSLGLMSGPAVSGVILSLTSWRFLFVLTAGFGCLNVLFGLFFLRVFHEKSVSEGVRGFDHFGSMLWVCLVFLFVLVITGFISNVLILSTLILVFIVVLLWFIRIEQRASHPILPVEYVKKRYYWIGILTSSLSFGALFIVLIQMPFSFAYLLRYSADEIGIAMMAVPVSLVIVSPFSGWLYDRFRKARIISTIGLLLSSGAAYSLTLVGPGDNLVSIAGRLALLGAGQALFLSPNSASVLSRVDNKAAGITAGILATARNFGMLTGAALSGVSFSYFFDKYSGGLELDNFAVNAIQPFLDAQQMTLGFSVWLLIISAIFSISRDA